MIAAVPRRGEPGAGTTAGRTAGKGSGHARARSSGSGRRPVWTPTAASANRAPHSRYGPASVFPSRARAGSARLGPLTAPLVVAHSTTDSARARRCGAARSVPAYRAARVVAVAAPRSAEAAIRDGQLPRTTATAAARAPAVAVR